MTSVYARNHKIDANKNIEKIVFNAQQNQIYVSYHKPEGCITFKEKTFKRDRTQLNINPNSNVIPNAAEERAENERVNNLDRECFSNIKTAETRTKEELKLRQEDEENIIPLLHTMDVELALSKNNEKSVLKKNIYDMAREKSK